MSSFEYRGGALHAEDVSLTNLAEKVGTPFYCYSAEMLRKAYTDLPALSQVLMSPSVMP